VEGVVAGQGAAGFRFPAAPRLQQHYPAAASEAGALFEEIHGRRVYVLSYLEGNHPPATPETYSRLGRLTAQLHAIEGYPHATAFDADFVKEQDLPDRAADVPFGDEYLKIADGLPRFGGLPKALIHTDIGPQNAIQRLGGEIVLIDCDDVGVGPAVLDIGFPLIQQFIAGEVLEDSARAFYDTYFAERSMTREEKALIFDAAVFISLDYQIYGDLQRGFRRIRWAIANRAGIERIYMD
jgi:Ser/Thr protein kinase RdoA (MazF antagonist)